MGDRVADHPSRGRAAWELGQLGFQPGLQILDEGRGAVLASGGAQLSGLAADIGFDGVELADPPQGFRGDGRRAALDQVEELTPQVRPAVRQRHLTIAASQGLVGAIAVGLQHA